MPETDDTPRTRFHEIRNRFEQGNITGSGTPTRERRFSTGAAQAEEIKTTIAERIAALEKDKQERASRRSEQAIAIDAELEWLRSLKIVSTRLAALREKYATDRTEKTNDPAVVYQKLHGLIDQLVPTAKDWKDATYVWYGKRGDALQRVDRGIEQVRTLLASRTPSAPNDSIRQLLTACDELFNAINLWSAKKLNISREAFEKSAAELEDRRLQNPKAKEYHRNLRSLAAVTAAFTALLTREHHAKTVEEARIAEMAEMFATLDFDGPTFQLGNLAKGVVAGHGVSESVKAVKNLVKEGAKEVSTHIALEFKQQALSEAANALDVLGVVDGVTALWNAYQAYSYMKSKQNMENKACTRLDDGMVLRMIDTLQSQIQLKCEQAAESAVIYAAAAATKAATQGAGAPVAEALKAMNKLKRVIEQVAMTAYERGELLAISAISRERQPQQFADRVVSNVTLTCYYIRLAAPQHLLRPLSFTLYQLDGGKSFKALHDTQEMTEALADVLELKECADEILTTWNTELKNLHERAVRTTPLDDILAIYSHVEPGKLKTLTNYFAGKSRNLTEDLRQKKEKLIAAFKRKVNELAQSARTRLASARA